MNSDINGVRKTGRPRRRQQDLEEEFKCEEMEGVT